MDREVLPFLFSCPSGASYMSHLRMQMVQFADQVLDQQVSKKFDIYIYPRPKPGSFAYVLIPAKILTGKTKKQKACLGVG